MSTNTHIEKNTQLNTAILFIVFNRLNTTKIVFSRIKSVKPPKLYIASDGPRSHVEGEYEKIQEIRDYILKNINWDCEIKILFRDKNLGCGKSVKTAIDWLFKYEEKGIILEDDIVPMHSFFSFCDILLEHYANESRIAMISGINHLHYQPSDSSYLFSKNKGCWGWATWKRAWINMDYEMNWRKSPQYNCIIENMGVTKYSVDYWNKALKLIDDKVVDAWDWQWYFSIAAHNQLCIFPEINLIENIGFGADATHTKGNARKEFFTGNDILFPLKHPSTICPNYEFDKLVEYLDMRKNYKHRLLMLLPLYLQNFFRKLYHRD
ncbi:hypothetical protein [Acinetobacter brisouii]